MFQVKLEAAVKKEPLPEVLEVPVITIQDAPPTTIKQEKQEPQNASSSVGLSQVTSSSSTSLEQEAPVKIKQEPKDDETPAKRALESEAVLERPAQKVTSSSSTSLEQETPVKIKQEPKDDETPAKRALESEAVLERPAQKVEPVTEEPGTGTIKVEVKTDPGTRGEIKAEMKVELGIKREVKAEIKAEPGIKREIKAEIKPELGIKREIKVEPAVGIKREAILKAEPEAGAPRDVTDIPLAKRRRLATKCPPSRVWELRIPRDPGSRFVDGTSVKNGHILHYVNQCFAYHQQDNVRWSLVTPCCLANMFLEPRARPVKGQPCMAQLSSDAREKLLEFIDSQQAHVFFETLKEGDTGIPRFFRHWWAWLLRPDLPEEDRVPNLGRGGAAQGLNVSRRPLPWMHLVPQRFLGGFGSVSTDSSRTLRQVSSFCTPGTKIYESVGKVRRRIKRKAMPQKDALQGAHSTGSTTLPRQQVLNPGEVPAPSVHASLSSGNVNLQSKRKGDVANSKVKVHISQRTSGVRNISWNETEQRWSVQYRASAKKVAKKFPINVHTAAGMQKDDAVCAALDEAKRFRADLIAQGVIKPTPIAARTSGVKGVNWFSAQSTWQVFIRVNGKRRPGKSFKPVDKTEEAIEAARLQAVRYRQELEQRHFDFVIR